jgi:hypothetical protein
MQKARCNRELTWGSKQAQPAAEPSSAGRAEVAVRNPMQTASSGHVPGSQLKTVQYPAGAVLSHKRSPEFEQSASMSHSSPISGLQPSAVRTSAAPATA